MRGLQVRALDPPFRLEDLQSAGKMSYLEESQSQNVLRPQQRGHGRGFRLEDPGTLYSWPLCIS
jgi:hypothetical protein